CYFWCLLYIRDDFKSVERQTWLQETIVSMAVAGAIVGAALGGWMNDRFGRRKSILVADALFLIGAIVMALAPSPGLIIFGRVLVGLGVVMASMTAPLYISEASPARIRGALVSTNDNWNLALDAWGGRISSSCSFIFMLSLPESPRWLYRQDNVEEARAILEKIYPADEVEEEMKALKLSVEAVKAEEISIGDDFISKLKGAWGNLVVRRGLYAGITVQVAQQFVGINTVMYYSPTLVQLAGFASNKTALALSLITSGLNADGSIFSMAFVDRFGRRRLMMISMFGIIFCLLVLSAVFYEASSHSPLVNCFESTHFGANSTCPSYLKVSDASSWNCMTCLKASSCAFCANGDSKYLPGACLAAKDAIRGSCRAERRTWYTNGCPSEFGIVAVLFLGLYILSYSPGMGTAPWIVNSEIYPLRYRGLGGGIAAIANWISNLVVS
ncbi:unnamed protein product, partial [Ilex paraguariensis]